MIEMAKKDLGEMENKKNFSIKLLEKRNYKKEFFYLDIKRIFMVI